MAASSPAKRACDACHRRKVRPSQSLPRILGLQTADPLQQSPAVWQLQPGRAVLHLRCYSPEERAQGQSSQSHLRVEGNTKDVRPRWLHKSTQPFPSVLTTTNSRPAHARADPSMCRLLLHEHVSYPPHSRPGPVEHHHARNVPLDRGILPRGGHVRIHADTTRYCFSCPCLRGGVTRVHHEPKDGQCPHGRGGTHAQGL